MSRPEPATRSPIRRGLLWWMAPPANPYVSLNVACDSTAARAYLDGLPGPDRPTLQTLLLVAVGRTLGAFPMANARIVDDEIVPQSTVGGALPVNLIGHPGEARAELSLVVVERLESRSLMDVSDELRRAVRTERQGKVGNPLMDLLNRALSHAPDRLLGTGLEVLDRALKQPALAEAFFRRLPATTLLSNVGAVVGGPGERLPEGVLMRSAHVSPPHRLLTLGTIWGAGPIQDEVVPVAGRPEVRPMLPLVLIFDHRLIDGVIAARVLSHLTRILMDPAATLGARGER